MNKKSIFKRLVEISHALGSHHVPPHVEQAAFEAFKASGELPEDVAVAKAVIDRIKRGYAIPYTSTGQVDWAELGRGAGKDKPRAKDDVMDALLNEAVHATGVIQQAARIMLVALAEVGLDVTTTLFVGRELPKYGGVGCSMLGFPEHLAKRPYVAQARRLFRRFDQLRERLPHEDPAWFRDLSRAIECFQRHGERPSDDLMLEAILALGELTTLMNHAAGEEVRERMALFDRIARASPNQREGLVAQLQEMAMQGLLAPAAEEG